ncbi:MAG TPA: DUF1326 domain-containing protein [Gemmataceae bacterium]|nr:DUF1326 domain-containing protein [Gemmataceae bacterium]
MKRTLAFTALALLLAAAPLSAAGLNGQYIEARTIDVWTGPCFANADVNIGGKHGIMAWKVEKGEFNKVNLDGLGVVAVLAASDTLGTRQTGTGKALLIVDARASRAQKDALIALAKQQGGELLRNIVAVRSAAVELNVCNCEKGGCGTLRAGDARIETRCLDHKHDTVCGNESAFFPPLSRDVTANPALAAENAFTGKGLNGTWKDSGRRSAYLGTFTVR